jgi:hypothetical protein
MVAVTRVLLGAGIGVLIANRFARDHRRLVGWLMLGAGALSTIPLAVPVWRQSKLTNGHSRKPMEQEPLAQE